MAKDKEFSFDEDGDDFSFEPEKLPKPKKPASGGGGGKRLLLLLLVLVAGAAAYFYLYGGLDFISGPKPTPAPKVAVKPPAQPAGPPAGQPAQPVTAQPAPPAATQPVPAKPAAQPVAAQPAKPAAQPLPAPPEKPVAAQPVAAKPVPQPVPVKPAQTAAQPVPVQPAKPAAAQAVPAKPAATQPVAAKTAPPAAAQPVVAKPAPPAVEGKFRLSAGAFLVKRNLLDTEKKLRKLGYEPQRSTVKRPIAMTRLRVGRFAPQEAAARLADLQQKYPEAFTMKSGQKVALYVGSYQNINMARSFADRLFLDDGIHVDEEPVTVKVPVTVVHFGAFADREAAEAAARQARTAGLDDISVVAVR